jgi:hypothetical protein
VSVLLGLEKLDIPFSLGKIAAGGFPDATSAPMIHGIPSAVTSQLPLKRTPLERPSTIIRIASGIPWGLQTIQRMLA